MEGDNSVVLPVSPLLAAIEEQDTDDAHTDPATIWSDVITNGGAVVGAGDVSAGVSSVSLQPRENLTATGDGSGDHMDVVVPNDGSVCENMHRDKGDAATIGTTAATTTNRSEERDRDSEKEGGNIDEIDVVSDDIHTVAPMLAASEKVSHIADDEADTEYMSSALVDTGDTKSKQKASQSLRKATKYKASAPATGGGWEGGPVGVCLDLSYQDVMFHRIMSGKERSKWRTEKRPEVEKVKETKASRAHSMAVAMAMAAATGSSNSLEIGVSSSKQSYSMCEDTEYDDVRQLHPDRQREIERERNGEQDVTSELEIQRDGGEAFDGITDPRSLDNRHVEGTISELHSAGKRISTEHADRVESDSSDDRYGPWKWDFMSDMIDHSCFNLQQVLTGMSRTALYCIVIYSTVLYCSAV